MRALKPVQEFTTLVFGFTCLSVLFLAACASLKDMPTGESAAQMPAEPVTRSEPAPVDPAGVATGAAVLEEAVVRPIPGESVAQPAGTAGIASNRRESPQTPEASLETLARETALQGTLDRRRAAEEMQMRSGASSSQEMLPPTLSSGDELWIITTATESGMANDESNEDVSPGSGAMLASYIPDAGAGSRTVLPLPLKHTEVHARIVGYVGTVDVTQQFENPFDRKIEAVYVFPLPEKAAVSEFVMTIGERRIRGILREREEAEAIYREARAQGYQASLLTQHRPNVFEQRVANIEPGHQIDVNIRYFHTLTHRDGWYSFVFPTVVGPRYNPPWTADPILAMPRTRVQPAATGTAVQYLRPRERSGHDIAITVELDAGVAIEAIEASHYIDRHRTGAKTATIELASRTTIPNRDFVLDFKVAGGQIKYNLLTYADPEDAGRGFFTMMLYPPADLESLRRHPLEMIFVLDCSGSMNGQPIEQAKAAIITALDLLEPNDTFQVIRFSNHASQFGRDPVRATRGNIDRAKNYVRSLGGHGGTRMIEGIRAALDFPHDRRRLRFVTFLTDGYIGNEAEILRQIHHSIGDSRIFSFGVGSSVNRYLLERMAIIGQGAVAYLGPRHSGDEVMNAFFERISRPALSDLEIDWGGMRVSDVYPSRLPDLFVGRPVVVTGRYWGVPGELTVHGRAGDRRIDINLPAGRHDNNHAFLPKIWARLRIADLMDRRTWDMDPYGELEGVIKNTALEYGLMSDYTAFVAVDATRTTAGDSGVTVVQPVPVAAGVRYETTVP